MKQDYKSQASSNEFRDWVDEERILYNWQQIQVKRKKFQLITADFRWTFAAVPVLVLLVAGFAFFKLRPDAASRATPLSFELSESTRMLAVPSKAEKQRRIPLSDGSTITLAPGASLEVRDNDPSRFSTAQHTGWVRYNVIPDKSRTWDIDAEICHIRVLGTQFTVNRTEDAVRIAVHRGKVAVYSHDEQMLATLSAGKTYTVRSPSPAPTPTTEPLPALAEDEQNLDELPPLSTLEKSPRAARHPAPPDRKPGAPRALSMSLAGLGASNDVNVLLTQADEARLGNRYQKAATLLEGILRQYPADPSAGLVALTLGNLRMDTLHQPQTAAWAFRTATSAKGLPASLREQAYARCVEAYRESGNLGAARAIADTYKRHFPNGEWLEWIERWTAAD